MELLGNDSLDADDIRGEIASRASPRFLGLFPGLVYEYEVFDRYVLERDPQRIERYYRARGYYHAKVRAGRVFYRGAQQIAVEILIEEGPPAIVRRLDLHGLARLPAPLLVRARTSVQSSAGVGKRFEKEAFERTEATLKELLSEEGYAFAKVRRSADVDLSNQSVAVGFWVEPGPIARIGEVRILGLGSIPERPVRRALALEPGEPSPFNLDFAWPRVQGLATG